MTTPLEKSGALLAPSILNADFACLADQVAAVENSGADLLHFDVMDGHFVPNLSFGPAILQNVNNFTDMPLDVHLMIDNPENLVDAFIEAGADIITVHTELGPKIDKVIDRIRAAGVQAGVVLNPDTPPDAVEPFLSRISMILAMSVYPGFGGQKFISHTLVKLKTLRKRINQDFPHIRLEVDGGLNRENVADVVRAGADVLVIGASIFRSGDIPAAVRYFRDQADSSRQ